MFDISFSELLIIGIVALVVIGPERLPKVARTVGHLVGRAQRYVNDVKSDIQREIQVDDITNLKNEMQEAASSLKASFTETSKGLRESVESVQKTVEDTASSIEKSTQSLGQTNAGQASESIENSAAAKQPEQSAASPSATTLSTSSKTPPEDTSAQTDASNTEQP